MSDANQEETQSEFMAVTGVAKDRAKFYLESANWNLQVTKVPMGFRFVHKMQVSALSFIT